MKVHLDTTHELHMRQAIGLQRSLDQLQSIIKVGEHEVLLIGMLRSHMQDPPQECIKLGGPDSNQLHLHMEPQYLVPMRGVPLLPRGCTAV